MNRSQSDVHRIELRLDELSQLFNSMDPTPFHHKDLDHDAAEFIESWAMEAPKAKRFHIALHLSQMPQEDSSDVVTEAIRNYYGEKGELAQRMVTGLLREGRISLVIGVAFLSTCLLTADLLTSLATGTFLKILRESLTIGGWVAMWRPMQIFLYEWWPLARRRRIYQYLSRAEVRVQRAQTNAPVRPPQIDDARRNHDSERIASDRASRHHKVPYERVRAGRQRKGGT